MTNKFEIPMFKSQTFVFVCLPAEVSTQAGDLVLVILNF